MQIKEASGLPSLFLYYCFRLVFAPLMAFFHFFLRLGRCNGRLSQLETRRRALLVQTSGGDVAKWSNHNKTIIKKMEPGEKENRKGGKFQSMRLFGGRHHSEATPGVA